jgi:hypothetical protein
MIQGEGFVFGEDGSTAEGAGDFGHGEETIE